MIGKMITKIIYPDPTDFVFVPRLEIHTVCLSKMILCMSLRCWLKIKTIFIYQNHVRTQHELAGRFVVFDQENFFLVNNFKFDNRYCKKGNRKWLQQDISVEA